MKIGSIVYATMQGLGILAKSFHDHGIVTDVVVVRHGRHHTYDEWYPDAYQITDLHDPAQIDRAREWMRTMDAMLFFETPFNWTFVEFCRHSKVPTVIMPMHECMPERIAYQPDLWLCPSLLDFDWAMVQRRHEHLPTDWNGASRQSHWKELGCCYLPVPVEVPWRQRTKAEVFVHNAGHGGLRGRNGTAELIEAMRLVKSPAKLVLSSQKETLLNVPLSDNIEVRPPMSYTELWKNGGIGDVFVFPEKFNGLSLPLQEARAAGMFVMATDRYPMNTWLPRAPLIPSRGTWLSRIGPPYSEFAEAIVHPIDIAQRIDEWYGRDISQYSLEGAKWASSMSWESLTPKYIQLLGQLWNRKFT